MKPAARLFLSFLIALATCMGAFALVGCGGGGQSASGAAASASAESSDAAQAGSDSSSDGGEQDNCYGDDMPAKKS